MKIVFSVPCYGEHVLPFHRDLAAMAPPGVKIVPLPAGPLGKLPSFPDIDRQWKRRDRSLFSYYNAIIQECKDADVFLSISAGVHPGLLQYLDTFNCYHFCDDPEDSPWQSARVAPFYDAAFYANIASSFQYESWGCRRHAWLPFLMGPKYWPAQAERIEVFSHPRTESVVFIGGLDDYSSYRRRRLERFSKVFPDGIFRGRGWPSGGIGKDELSPLYLRSRIGFNIHRTTGPINLRMYQLPAHGVMQICDNKTGLGQIFELGKEVVGFDTIDEAIDLTKYYLEHEAERNEIAHAGYERFWRNYHSSALLEKLRDQLFEWGVKPGERKLGVKQKLPSRNVSYFFGSAIKKIQDETQAVVRSAKAAKREYLRKDPWWKIYDRVFTSEAVYLPEFSDFGGGVLPSKAKNTRRRPSDGTQRMAGETPYLHSEAPALHENASLTPQEGALRWAMTQLIGGATQIGIFDLRGDELERYASVDAKRRIVRIADPDNFSEQGLDLLLCVPDSTDSHAIGGHLRSFSKISSAAVFGFPVKTTETLEQNLTLPDLNADAVFWMLKSLYTEVFVFEMPDSVVPWLEPANFGGDSKSFVALARTQKFS
jgi:hypothetical protein